MNTKREYIVANPKILIVDDDQGIQAQLKWGLEGYDVITADSRSNAIEQFNTHHPALVTLDLGLPPDVEGTTEGFATLKAILQEAPETKVIIVSGSEDVDNAEKARNGGAFEFYPKPVDVEQLSEIIRRAYETYNKAIRL